MCLHLDQEVAGTAYLPIYSSLSDLSISEQLDVNILAQVFTGLSAVAGFLGVVFIAAMSVRLYTNNDKRK